MTDESPPVRLDVRVPHLPTPERKRSLSRLMLGMGQHPRASVTIHTDPGRTGEFNVWSCWSAPLDDDTTHRLVVEDDMIPCRDFLAATIAALEARPDKPLALFSIQKNTSAAYRNGHHWTWHKRFLAGGAMLLPRHHVEALVADPPHPPGSVTCDRLVNRYVELHCPEGVNFVCPSFLDHDADMDSTLHQRTTYPPIAACAYGPYGSPLGEDWSDPTTYEPTPRDLTHRATERWWVGGYGDSEAD